MQFARNFLKKHGPVGRRASIDGADGRKRIFDYRQHLSKNAANPQKALVSYLVPPVLDELENRPTPLFSNNGAGRTIPKVLNQLGYVVDIVNWDDTGPIDGNYDVILFHGGKNFSEIIKLKKPTNKLIYYSTGSYWKYHNQQEEARLKYFERRHGIKYKLDRAIVDSEEEPNRQSDAIVVLGNHDTALTYGKFPKVYNLEGASMPLQPRNIRGREDGKLGFLFMAGPGNLHKGLDIILDAWTKLPDKYELHIVTYLDDEFKKFYERQLYHSTNVVTHGYVLQRSDQYNEIIKKCQLSILLSCSEGSPGSVIESLHQGLVPIISKQSHVDLDGHGYVIEKNTPEEITRLVNSLNKESIESLIVAQKSIQTWATEHFAVARYEHNLSKIIQDIVA